MSSTIEAVREDLLRACAPVRYGRVQRMVGMSVEVAGLPAAIGDGLVLEGDAGPVHAEVVGLAEGRATCLPLTSTTGLRVGTLARDLRGPLPVRVGEAMLGRVFDGLGEPLDGRGRILGGEEVSLANEPPDPLERSLIDTQLQVGVRAIDSLVPIGIGQRLGIFAGSGVGKSSLLSMITRNTSADITVVGLIGERGREVGEFIEHDLGADGLRRAVVVVATSDAPALTKIRAAFLVTRIAEWFRDAGAEVLLLMDSLTRFAMAQREVGLAAGEPPATRGYPPSVFGLLPRLLERAGRAKSGSITGLYTVLVEGDDLSEPIADHARSILDGHLYLSRALAEANHYPAIDVLGSVSRVAGRVQDPEVAAAGAELRRLLAAYRDAKDLIEIDAYVRGTNPVVDRAIALRPRIEQFLCQRLSEPSSIDSCRDALFALVGTNESEVHPR